MWENLWGTVMRQIPGNKYTHEFTHTNVHKCVRVHACTHAYTHIHTHTHTHTHTYTHKHTHTNTHTNTNTHTHTQTHTQTHTHAESIIHKELILSTWYVHIHIIGTGYYWEHTDWNLVCSNCCWDCCCKRTV